MSVTTQGHLVVFGERISMGRKYKDGLSPHQIVIVLTRSEEDRLYRFSGMFCVDCFGRVFLHKATDTKAIERFDQQMKLAFPAK